MNHHLIQNEFVLKKIIIKTTKRNKILFSILKQKQIEKNSMRKCEIRKEIFAISDRLKTYQERAYVLKKKEKAFLLPLSS